MNVSLAQSAAALNANARWQEAIAQNLAAASVPGYKKQEFSLAALPAGVLDAPSANTLLMPQGGISVNFTPGNQKATGVRTDVALEGPGFLAVQMPDGATAYTRDGELALSPTGQLVSKEGYPILGVNGLIQLDLNASSEFSISSTGEVSQGTDIKGRLQATEFNDPRLLTPISRGYYLAAHPNLESQDAGQTTFRQGFLESANTTAASEMAQLIAAMRIYEANQRALQTNDDRMSRTIAELGSPN